MNTDHPNPSLQRKHAARIAAVQFMYSRIIDPSVPLKHLLAWQQEQMEAKDKETTLPYPPDKKLLQGLITGCEEFRAALENKMQEILTDRWSGKRMPAVMRAIFLTASYELIYTPALRTSIIIDQYVGVADAFLDESDIGFVNGVLQEISAQLRPTIPHA